LSGREMVQELRSIGVVSERRTSASTIDCEDKGVRARTEDKGVRARTCAGRTCCDDKGSRV
jgi:hypothetical protein